MRNKNKVEFFENENKNKVELFKHENKNKIEERFILTVKF